MSKYLVPVIGWLVFLVMPAAHAGLKVVSTTEDLAALAQAVGGEHIEVYSLTRGTRDPHYAEAKPSMIRQVRDADLLLLIGADMEVGWLPALLKSSRNGRILPGSPGYLDLSTTVTLLDKATAPVTRDMGDVHARGNPHYWLDPGNGLLMARAISARLAMLDPARAERYQRNLDNFERQLAEQIGQWKATLAFLQGKKVIAYHNSLVYLAQAFDFEIVDEIEPKPGIAPSAAHLNRLIRRIKDEEIGLLIMEPFYERRSARLLQDKTAIDVVVIPQSVGAQPGIKDYLQLFDAIVFALSAVREG